MSSSDDDELDRARSDETVDDPTRLDRLAAVAVDLPSIPLDALLLAYRRPDDSVGGVSYGDIAALARIGRDLQQRLARIAARHAQATGPAGRRCVECGKLWPCDTHRMAVNTDGVA